MRRLTIDPLGFSADELAPAVDVLRSDGVVALPTDTLYALAVDPTSERAVSRLFDLKGRHAGAAIALLAADGTLARQAGTFSALDERLADTFWPGPLTIVVPAAPALSSRLAPRGTIGVRVPAHGVARGLSALFGKCVTATSANRSGAPAAVTPDDVASALSEHVDLLIDAGPSPGGPPSTVVEIVDGRPILHRAGVVSWDRVLRSLA